MSAIKQKQTEYSELGSTVISFVKHIAFEAYKAGRASTHPNEVLLQEEFDSYWLTTNSFDLDKWIKQQNHVSN